MRSSVSGASMWGEHWAWLPEVGWTAVNGENLQRIKPKQIRAESEMT